MVYQGHEGGLAPPEALMKKAPFGAFVYERP